MTNLVIIGGSDAGISAALRAHEVDSTSKITVIVADQFPNYSICGIPYFFSGEVPDRHNLAHRTTQEIANNGIDLLLNHLVTRITAENKSVIINDPSGSITSIRYDKLVIGTGAKPTKPAIEGINVTGVFMLRTMGDMLTIDDYLSQRKPRTVAIIGAGYIGLEMAETLTQRGLSVTLIQRNHAVLITVDADLGALVQTELEQHGITVKTNVIVERFVDTSPTITVQGAVDFNASFDMVLVAVGVQPVSELAQSAGIAVGLHGAIKVNRHMETNLPDIYGAGDCVETWHHVLNRYDYLPLGSTAHKQGRIAGENAVGGSAQFAGTLGTQVVKLFDLVVARTGLNDRDAQQAGYLPLTTSFETWDHKVYYPGATKLNFHVTGDRQTGQFLGAQMVGHKTSEVSKRIDIFATALFHNMTVRGISDLDLSYTPPLSTPWDAVQMAAQNWEQQLKQSNSAGS